MKDKPHIFHTVYGFNPTYDPDKPYDICVGCSYINSAKCNGPNFLAMTPERRCEWLQRRRAFLRTREPEKWSYDYVAEAAQVGKNTVVSIFTDPEYDARVSTLERVVRVMVSGQWGEASCPLLAGEEAGVVYTDTPETIRLLAEKSEQVMHLQHTLDNIHEFYTAELNRVRSERNELIDVLIADGQLKDKIIDKLIKD